MKMMRFSIVVPTLDRREMLLSALASIRAQNWPEVETIVVDGGSTDGTLEALATLPDICLLEGPDRGVYDAFNKGIARATGEVVGVLNSDDAYEPGSFAAVADAFARNPGADAVCGSAAMVADDKIIAEFDDEADKLLTTPRAVLIGKIIPNARFFRRSAMLAVGLFSLDYRYVSDRDWLMRWRESGFTTASIPRRVYRYRQHAGSLTFGPPDAPAGPLRADLMALARRWRLDGSASRTTRRDAALLEGRCRAMLALEALQRRDYGAAARLVCTSGGAVSAAPLGMILRACADRVRELSGKR